MSMPFYVAPEQLMKDKADFARKNIARGRPLVASTYAGGIVLAGENGSSRLRKISEIYDRIAFAGVGRFNEFDLLRVAGVRNADFKGYEFSREDVDARGLANFYAQHLGQVFTHEMKPMEVEILVAEVGLGEPSGKDQLFHILFDGTVFDEDRFSVLGGENDAIQARMKEAWSDGWDLSEALRAAVSALAGPDRTLAGGDLEVAVLERRQHGRAFRRVAGAELAGLLGPITPE
ncbi:MAG: proteasome subunit alpha, partial [Acidimicrobiales bacterium]